MRTTLLPLLGLLLGAGVVAAAPTPTQRKTPKPQQAERPTTSAALSAACRQCLAGGSCTPAQRTSCRTQVEGVLEDHWDATESTPKLPMMRLGLHEIPSDLTQGKYFKYTKPRTTFTSIMWPKGKVEAVPFDRISRADPDEAAKAHRQPSWDANGQKIATCEEYAYEEQYDVMRFLDAAMACRGDRECIMDVAYLPTTPGIAGRRLNRKDGEALTTFGPFPLQLTPFQGVVPKNDMFQLGNRYLYSRGRNGSSAIPKDAELEAWLAEGQSFYAIGSSPSDDEWAWHKKMRERTAGVTEAEREEYELRLAEFRMLTAQHGAAVAAHDAAVARITQPKEHEIVLPYDKRTGDIFERYDRVAAIRDHVARVRTQVDRAMKRGKIPRNATQPATPQPIHEHSGIQQQRVQQQHSAREASPGPGMLGAVLGAPPPVQRDDDSGPSHTATPDSRPKARRGKRPQTAEVSPCLLGNDDEWGLEVMGEGRISCLIGEFLRKEWARKKAGHKSCLDRNNYGCDWKPATFTGRVVDKVPELDRYKWFLTRCKAWTSGTFSPPAENLTALKAIIDQAELEIGEARTALKPYSQPNNTFGRVYAGRWGEEKNYGDDDWFGAHLDFGADWDVAAAAKTGDNNNVCSLAGGMSGRLNASAQLAFFEANLVKGDVAAEINKPGAVGQARFKSQLVILGAEVYKKPNGSGWVTSQIVEEGQRPAASSPKASFQVVIGGVPVTGSLWGEMGLGYALRAKGTAPPACVENDTSFKVDSGFGPVLSAVGRANVGVGIAGIVSAGISAALTIVRIDLPLSIDVSVTRPRKPKSGPWPEAKVTFGSSLDLMLSTLAGRVSLYVEFLMFTEEWELFRWSGIGPATVHLMPRQDVELPMSGMRP